MSGSGSEDPGIASDSPVCAPSVEDVAADSAVDVVPSVEVLSVLLFPLQPASASTINAAIRTDPRTQRP